VAASAAAGEFSLPITVEEPAAIARKTEPVSAGIPLPWGRFKADQSFALFDGKSEVPVQALPIVVDEEGFLRWILLDFQTDLGPNEVKRFTLRPAAGSCTLARPVKVIRDDRGVTVDTGRITFAIAKDSPFSLFSMVRIGSVVQPPPAPGRPAHVVTPGWRVVAGGEVSYTDAFDGKRYVAERPASIEVEYEGPMRATVCVKGRFVGDDQSKFLYIARITAWAGRSDVHVKYSLANSNPDHYCYRRVKDSTIALKLAGQPQAAILGAGKALEAAGDCWLHQSSRVVPAAIHSHDSLGRCKWFRETPGATGPGGGKAMRGDKELWTSRGKGDVAEGWIAARLGRATVWACDFYFIEDPPRRLALADGALRLTGITEPLDGAKPPFREKQRWLFDCSHLSSQYMFDFAAPGDTAELAAKAKRARARLWAMAPPAWYFQTESLPVGRFGTQADELACYERWGWKHEKADSPTRPAGQTARIQRWVAADDNHFTSEQDTLDALVLMYLRTGRRAFFDAAETWANYFLDLQTWRTDGWRWKDGGVWWHGGPGGNRPQRAADPVTGLRNSLPAEWTREVKTKIGTLGRAACTEISVLFLAKACYCHNWGEGLAAWFCLTGEREALEAALDTVEQNIDTQRRAFRKRPGQASRFSRDFTRACYLTNATRMIVPTDPFVVEASDYLAKVYLERPTKEPRGFVNGPAPARNLNLKKFVGEQGIAAMKRLGVTMDPKTGQLTDPRTGAKWFPLVAPHTWMFPPLSRAMGLYYRLTGNEDALDWVIAYGQAVAHVLFQPKHGTLSYGRMLVDFPLKGVAKDWASWVLPDDAKDGEGVAISGYLARFHPDVAARGYSFSGEPFLKKRAYDFWYYGSHRGYKAKKLHNVGGVGRWVNTYSTHDECVCFTGRTFYEWSHPRKDDQPPRAVTDLKVTVQGDKATLTFSAPADEGGGRVARYQVKCSEKPIVSYEDFLNAWAANQDRKVRNWWMAANLRGEPEPKAPGTTETFTVTAVPQNAKYFAVRSFDDSRNRSKMSNVATVR